MVLVGWLMAWPAGANDHWNPQALCDLSRSLGIMGTPRYRQQSKTLWECSSARKKLPQGEPASASDLRFRVMGNATEAQQLVLELRMRSYRQPQGVLREFSRSVDALLEKVLGSSLSDDMYKAIMAPVDGLWTASGYRLRLHKLHSKGSVYDLHFSMEALPSE